jgi:CD2 antigen cytoplasmic tail-binding protein 2
LDFKQEDIFFSFFCKMSDRKRVFDAQGESHKKRVRFDKNASKRQETDFEFNHEEELEDKKNRRGAVNFDVYDSDDEEVGFDSDSEDESIKKKPEPVVPKDEDFDMFGAPVEGKGKEKQANPNQVIEGQDFESRDRDSDDSDDVEDGQKKEPKLTAFNMNQEMEEGHLDDKGNYILNKADPQAFHDQWMEGISRKDINSAKEAQERRERDEALKEAERQSNLPQTEKDIYMALVEYLKPGQSVQEALTALANSLPKKLPAWKQKMLDKKNKNKKKETQPQLSEEEEASRRKKVEIITGLADQMMALGQFNIYQDTLEIMVRYLRKEGAVAPDWLPASARNNEDEDL